MSKVLMGCDPEVFLYKVETDEFIPSCGLIGGSKDMPLKVQHASYDLAVLEDNVTLEFNIAPQSTPMNLLYAAVESVYHIDRNILAPLGLCGRSISSVQFSPEALASEQAQMFGCDPDLDAYAGGAVRRPPSPRKLGGWRFAGGHIHLGYDKNSTSIPEWAIVQMLDAMALLSWPVHYADSHGLRRRYYGLPGLYRSKSYGLEYRSPCNAWLSDTGINRSFLYNIYYTLRGMLADEERARSIYNLIDWDAVRAAAAEPRYTSRRVVAALRSLDKHVAVIRSLGEASESHDHANGGF